MAVVILLDGTLAASRDNILGYLHTMITAEEGALRIERTKSGKQARQARINLLRTQIMDITNAVIETKCLSLALFDKRPGDRSEDQRT